MRVHILSLLLLISSAHAVPTATVEGGVVIGTATSLAGASITVDKFLGVPFAASPTRFAPPTSATRFASQFNATRPGPACPQQFNYPEAARNQSIAIANTPPPPAGESEDCLNLNIYVPGNNATGRAVMVWMYGGNLQYGANSLLAYDGTSFATYQGVVLVTMNYRTNIFGFPGPVPQLNVTQRNLGFLDQRFALEWIRRNIAAFGGDPNRVTIFGESAGSASVDNLITTTPNNPPFQAAIMQSGQNAIYVNVTSNVPTSWNAVVQALNCTNSTDQLACVRAAPRQTITNIIERARLAFTPYNDNVTFLANPEAARLAGRIARVPILTGTNANEGRSFVVGQNNLTQFLTSYGVSSPAIVGALRQLFNNTPGIVTDYDLIAQLFTEIAFQCPTATVANETRALGVPAWRYYYNASFPNAQPFLTLVDLKAFHSSEIPLVFNTYTNPPLNASLATVFEGRLSEFMQASWATFARNPYGGPGWAAYPSVAVLGTGATSFSTAAGTLRTVVNSTLVDGRCSFYGPINQALGMTSSTNGSTMSNPLRRSLF